MCFQTPAEGALNEVVWTESARAHLDAIQKYIERFNPRAARDVAASLKALGDSLRDFPYRGRPIWGTDLRELVSVYHTFFVTTLMVILWLSYV